MKIRSARQFNILFFIGLSVLVACKKDRPVEPKSAPTGPLTTQEINAWMLDSLRYYYYWTDQLPANPDMGQEPKAFFTSIKNVADRFSFFYSPSIGLTLPPNNRAQYGFDYVTFKEPITGKVVGVVKLVLDNSSAQRAGIKRGDYITRINDTELTESNASMLQEQMLSARNVKLTLATFDDTKFVETPAFELFSGLAFPQPIITKVITTGNIKLGYLFLLDLNAAYRKTLLNKIADLKAAGVTQLAIDLRYNLGGDVAAAAALCSMIAPGIQAGTPFIEYRGNKHGGTRIESFGETAVDNNGPDFNTLRQASLNLNKVFILSGNATASAAEVVINNLKPYVTEVIQVGEQTLGKDEASFIVNDQRQPKRIDIELHPIVYKIFNSQKQGGYNNGIKPDIQVNELSKLPLLPFGDEADPLLAMVITRLGAQAKSSQQVMTMQRADFNNVISTYADSRTSLAINSVLTIRKPIKPR